MGAVSFLVIVPSASTAAKRRNVVLPSTAQSVTITLDSVNGTTYTATPTTANLTSSTSGCTATTAQLSCVVNVSVPAGTLVFTVAAYSGASGGGTLIATGNLSVTATAGQTVTAPTTLSGTLAKIVLSVGAAELGSTVNVPVTIQAEDSNGNTILGTYNAAITLSDSDASGQTKLSATNIPDSGTGAAVTLQYLGGTMASPAAIGASASGVSASNITAASFSPDQTNPSVNGNNVTFNFTEAYGYGVNALPTSTPYSNSGSFSETYTTGQTFDGVSNAFTIGNAYYVWSSAGANAVLGYLGYANGSTPTTCASPYYTEMIIPIPASWNAVLGTGACTYAYNYNYGPTEFENESSITNGDGSYSYSDTYNYTCCSGSTDFGSESQSDIGGVGTDMEDYPSGSYLLTIPVPSPNAATVTATLIGYPSGTFPPSATPTPQVLTAPNPWTAIGVSGGQPPSPLESDVYTTGSTTATLPAGCSGAASIVGTNSLTEINESYSIADPLNDQYSLYETEANQYYYLNGVGEVCETEAYVEYYFDDDAQQWYNGSDQYWDSCAGTESTYLTATSLTAVAARVRSMSAAGPTAAAIFSAAAHTEMMQLRKARFARILKRQSQRGRPAARTVTSRH